MESDTLLDNAVFQLSPKKSRCELFVSGEGKTEKLASGFLKPFVTHLRVAEEQVAQSLQAVKLEVHKNQDDRAWFTKGTLERFVRFVSTPEVLELANTFDAEMTQLEAARKIYSQGSGNQFCGAMDENQSRASAAADASKRELLRAIDVRLMAVRQDVNMACTRAAAAGFTLSNVSELLHFAEHFRAHRLNEACKKFISLCQRRPDVCPWREGDRDIRSSCDSDMSIDDLSAEPQSRGPQTSNKPVIKAQDETGSIPLAPNGSVFAAFTSQASRRPSSSDSAPPPTRRYGRESSVESGEGDNEAAPIPKDPAVERETSPAPPDPCSRPARRLSVQDRINLFENKQKEQTGEVRRSKGSGSGGLSSSTSETRRLSTDFGSSAPPFEKLVLRRWSGASDMSIDARGDLSSPSSSSSTPSGQFTPCSQFAPSGQSSSRIQPSAFCNESKPKNQPTDPIQSRDDGDFSNDFSKDAGVSLVDSKPKESVISQSCTASCLPTEGPTEPKVQPSNKKLEPVVFSKGEQATVDDRVKERIISRSQSASSLGRKESIDTRIAPADPQLTTFSVESEDVNGMSKSSAIHAQFRAHPGKVQDAGSKAPASLTLGKNFARKVDSLAGKISPVHTQFPSFSKFREGGINSPVIVHSQTNNDLAGDVGDVGGELSAYLPQSKMPSGLKEDRETKELHASSLWNTIRNASNRAMDGGTLESSGGENLQRQSSVPGRNRPYSAHKEGNLHMPPPESIKLLAEQSSGMVSGNLETLGPSATTSAESTQKTRQPKGYQDQNSELEMKASELELLFAAHKLKVPSDQSSGCVKGKVLDHQPPLDKKSSAKAANVYVQDRLVQNSVQTFGNRSNGWMDFDVKSLTKATDRKDFSDRLSLSTSISGPIGDSRGAFYVKYMQRREEKLREESAIKRAQREAKMKAMQEALEKSSAEMKTKFSRKRYQDLPLRQHTEKNVPNNVRGTLRSREGEGDGSESGEDLQMHAKSTSYKQHIGLPQETELAYRESVLNDIIKISQTKKPLPNGTLSSHAPRSTRSRAGASKPSNNVTGNHWSLGENTPEQSLQKFSDQKDKSRSSSAKAKGSGRSLARSFVRSKSGHEGSIITKDYKHRSQSLRKSSVDVGELKDVSPIYVDTISLKPLRFSEEVADQDVYNRIVKNDDSKPVVPGDAVDPNFETDIFKSMASMKPLTIENATEPVSQPVVETVKYEDDDDNDASFGASAEGADVCVDDDDKAWICRGSDKSEELQFENGNGIHANSNMKDSSSTLSSFSSHLNPPFSSRTDYQEEEESPRSWKPQVLNPFAYDLEASVDSPTSSPASLNIHPSSILVQADAIRMRKKWGAAERPILEATASQRPLKDVKTGFKRLLKFGRKSRRSDHLVRDWVSASTPSEGDDDADDGHDLADHSSEDLLKSRMGFLHSQFAIDGFQGEMFQQQESTENLRSSIPAPPANFKLRDHLSGSSLKAPRSIFSLSSFRSK